MSQLRKGQYSTFMKPLIIMVFGGLLISLLTTSLNFNIGLAEEQAQVQFQNAPSQDFSQVANCLSVDEGLSGSDYLLNQTKLERMDKKYNLREPECAENFRYGYEVEVEQHYLKGVSPGDTTRPADVVFALDDSLSMDSYMQQVKQNTQEFMNKLPEGSRVGMFTYAQHEKDPTREGEIDAIVELTHDPSAVINQIESVIGNTFCCTEAEDRAIEYAMEGFDFRQNSRKMIIILATEPATKDSSTPRCGGPEFGNGAASAQCLQEWAEEADNRDFTIYTLADVQGQYDDIAETTDGKYFQVSSDYSSVFEEIAGEEKFIGGKSTCTVPPVRNYNGSAQVVFYADASDQFDEEWETMCDKVDKKIDTLEARGLKANVSFYAPGQPGSPGNGQGEPMQISGSDYDYSSTVPSCVVADENNAVVSSHGRGITEWSGEGLAEYNSSKDSGLEAWGVSAKWILENHDWNESADRRMMFVIGDQDPTGGDSSGGDFRNKSGTEILDNETEIVRNVTNLSENESVSVYTMSGEMEYQASDQYGDPEENDARELMKKVSSESGGAYLNYQSTEKIPRKVQEQFRGLSEQEASGAGTCTNVTYSFGEKEGSEGSNLDRSLTASFPASVRQSEKLTTPATVKIELRKGSLERLAGGINKAISTGERLGENTSVYVSINNEETLEVRNEEVERKQRTEYKLRNPDGDSVLDMHDDLMIGVNGRTVFQDRDQAPSNLDFNDESLHFEAYKGASLQIIALNTVAPDLKLEKLELRCVNGCPNNGQIVNPETIQASEGSEEYQKLGGLGPFYHNFTQVEIGKVENVDERAVCYADSESCVVLRSQDVKDLTLRPGSHDVQIQYSPSQGVSFQ